MHSYIAINKEKFSLVVKMDIVRAMIVMATSKGWSIHQKDLKNAFFHDELQEACICKEATLLYKYELSKLCMQTL